MKTRINHGLCVLLAVAGALAPGCHTSSRSDIDSVYNRWQGEQRQMLRIARASGNGLRPFPEENKYYASLVALGPKSLPKLTSELNSEMANTPINSVSFFLACAVVRIAGWDYAEFEKSPGFPDDFGIAVLKRYAEDRTQDNPAQTGVTNTPSTDRRWHL